MSSSCASARAAIVAGGYDEFQREFLALYRAAGAD